MEPRKGLPVADTTLARRIYAKRHSEHLSLTEAARQAKVSLVTLWRMEKKEDIEFKTEVLVRVARWLRVDPVDFIMEEFI